MQTENLESFIIAFAYVTRQNIKMFKKKYIHISKINVKMICLLAKMAQLTKLLKSYIACWMLFTMIMFSQPFNCRSFNL